jgi:hemolysin activation/secretion protein
MKNLLVISLFTFCIGATNAAPPDIDAIQRSQQQLIEDQLRQQELQNVAAQSPYAPDKAKSDNAKAAKKTSDRCVEIKTISFGGNTILSDRAVRRITSQYETRCLHVEEINTILNDI